jgi:hypothetical protein
MGSSRYREAPSLLSSSVSSPNPVVPSNCLQAPWWQSFEPADDWATFSTATVRPQTSRDRAVRFRALRHSVILIERNRDIVYFGYKRLRCKLNEISLQRHPATLLHHPQCLKLNPSLEPVEPKLATHPRRLHSAERDCDSVQGVGRLVYTSCRSKESLLPPASIMPCPLTQTVPMRCTEMVPREDRQRNDYTATTNRTEWLGRCA